MKIAELLEIQDCAYMACVTRSGDIIKAEIQTSDYWAGGDEGGFTDNSNIYFENAMQAQVYYNNNYRQVFAFEEDYEADDKCEELTK